MKNKNKKGSSKKGGMPIGAGLAGIAVGVTTATLLNESTRKKVKNSIKSFLDSSDEKLDELDDKATKKAKEVKEKAKDKVAKNLEKAKKKVE